VAGLGSHLNVDATKLMCLH